MLADGERYTKANAGFTLVYPFSKIPIQVSQVFPSGNQQNRYSCLAAEDYIYPVRVVFVFFGFFWGFGDLYRKKWQQNEGTREQDNQLKYSGIIKIVFTEMLKMGHFLGYATCQ